MTDEERIDHIEKSYREIMTLSKFKGSDGFV
jgi:hypothetical protein